MNQRLLLIVSLGILLLDGCSEVKPRYRDTSSLEAPPRIDIPSDKAVSQERQTTEHRKKTEPWVFIDDAESPPVLLIKKLPDRAWEVVSQALADKKIEVTDKNREEGVFLVKYDPSKDIGKTFGNVRFLWFEDDYGEAEYQLTLKWKDTETQVRARLIKQAEVDDDDEELADGSAKLIQALYDAIHKEETEDSE